MGDLSVSDADMEAAEGRLSLESFWQALIDGKEDKAAEIYHVNAVLTLPQTSERIAGKTAVVSHGILEAGERPVKLNSIIGNDGIWVSECEARWHRERILIISIAEMESGQIIRETRYRMPQEWA